jgi:HSP20 family protein
MTNLIVRRKPWDLPRPSTEPEPYRWMLWDPLRQMAPFWTEEPPARFTPDFEMKETREGLVIKADLPGIKEEDLELTLTGNRLTITGKRDVETEETTDTYYTCERSYGTFSRVFTLPEGIDTGHQIQAELQDGVLTLILPKKTELKPRRIVVKGTKIRSS